LFTYPAYNIGSYIKNKAIIDEIIAKQKSNFVTISDANDYIFKDEFFFDTGYHLNIDGVKARTYMLADDLNNYFNLNQ
jgi:hypothetical protein